MQALIAQGPQARFHLEAARPIAEDPRPEPGGPVVSVPDQARGLAYHPVIVGQKVLVADGLRVLAFDALTHRAEVWFDLAKMDGKAVAVVKPARETRHTLTVADGRVYARLGRTLIGPDQEGNSWLVCLSLEAAAGQRLRWAVKAGDVGGAAAVFEGAPVVAEGRLLVGVTSFQAGRAVSTATPRYAANGEGPAGPVLLWRNRARPRNRRPGRRAGCIIF